MLSLFDGDGDAVAEDEGVARDGGDAGAGRDDASEVQGITGVEADDLAGALAAADAAEAIDRFRQAVLFADEAGDEASASDDASRFLSAEGAYDIAPWQCEVLACDEIAEDDAVAREQLHRELSGERVGGG